MCSKEMYGEYSNMDDLTVENWNMQTTKKVEPDKIGKIVNSIGKEDVISILTEMYDKNRNHKVNYDILGDFMDYIKEKEIQIYN